MFKRKNSSGRRKVETKLVEGRTCRSHWKRRDLSQTQSLVMGVTDREMKGKTQQREA